MSLNDSTLEGDFYNIHNTKAEPVGDKDPFKVFANTITKDLFNKKPLIRRIYESIRDTTKRATSCITRRG